MKLPCKSQDWRQAPLFWMQEWVLGDYYCSGLVACFEQSMDLACSLMGPRLDGVHCAALSGTGLEDFHLPSGMPDIPELDHRGAGGGDPGVSSNPTGSLRKSGAGAEGRPSGGQPVVAERVRILGSGWSAENHSQDVCWCREMWRLEVRLMGQHQNETGACCCCRSLGMISEVICSGRLGSFPNRKRITLEDVPELTWM